MTQDISALMDRLNEDPWRAGAGFSLDLQDTLERTLEPGASAESVEGALNEWLARYQPCLFGRIAAKHGLLRYCLLTEEDLAEPDEAIKKKIQQARLEWTRLGFEGKASGFVIVLLSPRLASAVPEDSVKQIALRICSLYLLEEIETDRAYLDRIYLAQPGSQRTTWEWVTGVNYFSAQGDKRWWQDHRFPAGMAFSVNSVGHMVKAGKLTRAMRDLEELMGTASGEFRNPKVDSLEKSLELAMRTIALASDGPSGKATTLVPLPRNTADVPTCPIELPPSLADKNYCEYQGFYHTDYTVPSEYFLGDVLRPAATRTHELDFTYLFDDALDNPDFDRTGEGRLIREPSVQPEQQGYRWQKRLRGVETDVEIDDIPWLGQALDH